jgi:hypothetical protein
MMFATLATVFAAMIFGLWFLLIPVIIVKRRNPGTRIIGPL